jgi:hypothetical protein
MFTSQHYNAVAKVLHDSRNAAIESENSTQAVPYKFWYDHVYTPIVKLFEEDNPRFSTVSFCYAVATGEYVSRRMDKKS